MFPKFVAKYLFLSPLVHSLSYRLSCILLCLSGALLCSVFSQLLFDWRSHRHVVPSFTSPPFSCQTSGVIEDLDGGKFHRCSSVTILPEGSFLTRPSLPLACSQFSKIKCVTSPTHAVVTPIRLRKSLIIHTAYPNNFFHSFNDLWLPLHVFLTTHQVDGYDNVENLILLNTDRILSSSVDIARSWNLTVYAAGAYNQGIHVEDAIVFDDLYGGFFYYVTSAKIASHIRSFRDHITQFCGEAADVTVADRVLPYDVTVINRAYGGRQLRNAEDFAMELTLRTFDSVKARVALMGEGNLSSVCSQIKVVRQTRVIVGAHGAGLVLSMFAHPKTTLVQLLVSRQCQAVALHSLYAYTIRSAGGIYEGVCIPDEDVIFNTPLPAGWPQRLLEQIYAWWDPQYYAMDFQSFTVSDPLVESIVQSLHSTYAVLSST